MKIMFKGLGPTGTVGIKNTLYSDGAIVELEEHEANAYINAKLAIPILDKQTEKAAEIKREQIIKNEKRRKAVIEEAKKEGEK